MANLVVEPDSAVMWLLTGGRPGERSQQRAVAEAVGVPYRELPVAVMEPGGRGVRFDFSALLAPWPRVAVSFGKTLEAALELRERAQGRVALVHLGLPRKLAVQRLDLIVPMPTDRYVEAPNVLRVRMPLNPAPHLDPTSAAATRLREAAWPRPWTALIVGGSTRRAVLRPEQVQRIARAVNARALAAGGSVLASTSPRTPGEALPLLRAALTAPGELHAFAPGDGRENPLAAYLHLADEAVVTGDSASMVAEAWRCGNPVFVAPMQEGLEARALHRLRRAVPDALIASGRVSGDVDTPRWIESLISAGLVGRLGEPARPVAYDPAGDDDLQRVAARIRLLLAAAT